MMEQGSEQWFAARLGNATASRFADVMSTLKSGGESSGRRNYRAQLLCERLTGKPIESFTSKPMLVGIEREPDARALYEAMTGSLVVKVGYVAVDPLRAGASPDGLIDDVGTLEIKCPNAATHIDYLRLPPDTAPSEYVAQIQGQLWATGRHWCDFVSYHPDFPEVLRLTIRRVARDVVYVDALAKAVTVFLQEVDTEESELRNMMEAVAA